MMCLYYKKEFKVIDEFLQKNKAVFTFKMYVGVVCSIYLLLPCVVHGNIIRYK